MDELELLPGRVLTPNATKTFVVTRLVVLLTCRASAPIALLISPTDLAAATAKRVLAITAYLMSVVLRHVLVIQASNALVTLLFALIPKIIPAPAQFAHCENAV
jgi:hypothetical protein